MPWTQQGLVWSIARTTCRNRRNPGNPTGSRSPYAGLADDLCL